MLVVRWVDRLGRNSEDVCDTIQEFMRRGSVIRTVINNLTFDGANGGGPERNQARRRDCRKSSRMLTLTLSLSACGSLPSSSSVMTR